MFNPATMHPRRPHRFRCIRFAAGFCAALLIFNPDISAHTATATPGWELLAQYRFKEALVAFKQDSVRGDPSKRSISLGEALSRLVSPSYNDTDLSGIVSQLEQIWLADTLPPIMIASPLIVKTGLPAINRVSAHFIGFEYFFGFGS
jgi:hypothetical protein